MGCPIFNPNEKLKQPAWHVQLSKNSQVEIARLGTGIREPLQKSWKPLGNLQQSGKFCHVGHVENALIIQIGEWIPRQRGLNSLEFTWNGRRLEWQQKLGSPSRMEASMATQAACHIWAIHHIPTIKGYSPSYWPCYWLELSIMPLFCWVWFFPTYGWCMLVHYPLPYGDLPAQGGTHFNHL